MRAAHNRLRIAKKREEERAADAPSKTRARACPRSVLGATDGGSPTFSLYGCFGRHLLAAKGGKNRAPRKNTRTAGSGIRRRFFGNILSCTFGLIPKFTIVFVFSPRQRLQAASAKMFAGAAMCGSARGGNSTGAATAIAAPVIWHRDACGRSGVFKRRFVRYGQLLTALGTTGGQHLATVSRGHSQAETVLVDSLPARRLERSFHCHSSILFVL